MGVKFSIECNRCGIEVQKDVSKEGNAFLGIAENGFVIQTTETLPLGWKGLPDDKVICSYCVQGMERPMGTIELDCQRCKKVRIIIPFDGKNIKEDTDEEISRIRQVASEYEFKEFEPMKFYCTTCAKEVKSEKIGSDSSTTPG